jgi:hypothetical protein
MRPWFSFLLSSYLIALLVAGEIFGATAAPSLMSYQGQLADASGNPLTGIYNMVFTIYDDASLGGPTHIVWQEAQNGTNVRNGLFSVMLGNGTPVVPLTADVFSSPDRWMGIKIGADPEIVPRSRLQSVAYSQKVNTIDKARGGIISGHVSIAQATKDGEKESASLTILGDVGDTVFKVSPASAAILNNSLLIHGSVAVADSSSDTLFAAANFRAKGDSLTANVVGVHGEAVGLFGAGVEGRSQSLLQSVGGKMTGTTSYGIAYGLLSEAYTTSADRDAFGISAYASADGAGSAISGLFNTSSHGSGPKIGVGGSAYGGSTYANYGVSCGAHNTSSGAAYGGYFSAGSEGTGTKYGVYAKAPSTGSGLKYGVYASAPTSPDGSYAGYFEGKVCITDSLVVFGGKSAAVRVDDGDYRLLYCQESPEVWFEDFGEAQLVNGKTKIAIDPLYLQTANTSVKYHVFLTPIDEPVTLAVANRTTSSFEVRGPAGSIISFSYRIVAKRRGYEDIRLPKLGGPTPEQVRSEESRHCIEWEQLQKQLDQERQKFESEKGNAQYNRIDSSKQNQGR